VVNNYSLNKQDIKGLNVTKVIQSKYKISRRLGVNLWGSAKDPYAKRNYPPGQHGPLGAKKSSDYGNQLRAKQKLRGYYGSISERQFRKIFAEASRIKGDVGENLVGLLEKRLDSVVYRLNFGSTIFAAKQLVSHKHIKVNGKIVNIASYVVKVGDVIELVDAAKAIPVVIESLNKMDRPIPDYITFDAQEKSATLARTPKLTEVPYPVVMEPHLVIEYYSR
jgi:small subunit ribosomal protein S4